ncbi:Present in the outer mitochondrial membrane proteome 31 [Trypanosoma cruzi]|uniref:Present in the outer mitochondrial membrane proteome 31 n=2 Tax=Trypanosoma cruzi TaxID=5693 RepID=Q4CZX9_TRYCC|nr:hypothetical protein, conserved [Trypanosoma cruzi]EAN85829.1 hypothetical protein, conserved [Trypanosoma cruzi]PWU96887.1 Present in the outer mitochondrial membrane proteome 31 [Trypanosoma cruzi]RNC43467.1 hypothetical protein TcCL_NonESM06843 [Trypanosoma cruzi]|eukprot:XP_807680.1 hypothetical protein [Trypanosoma cruzi strain CL Brener]
MDYLRPINTRVETARLLCGSIMRLCLCSFSHYVGCGLFSRYVLRREGSLAMWERESVPYVASLGMEIGVSALICPVRYLAAVTTPRFILDYTMTGWSDTLSLLDRFSPANFAAYAMYAFSSDSDWNLDFFAWQAPSVVLTLVKLYYRRRKLGSESCRTKRVLAMIPFQMFLRAYIAGFSVMIPENSAEAVSAVVVTVVESMVTSYLARHTWPFANMTDSPQTGSSKSSDNCEVYSDDAHPNKTVAP